MIFPRIIHQTWVNSYLPPLWSQYRDTWKAAHQPSFEFWLWTNVDILNFIQEEFLDFWPLYQRCLLPAERVLLWKYLVLYKFGGFTIDLDVECLAALPVQEWEQGGTKVVFAHHSSPIASSHSTCFMGSIPGHYFWVQVLQRIQRNAGKLFFSQVARTTMGKMFPQILTLKRTGALFLQGQRQSLRLGTSEMLVLSEIDESKILKHWDGRRSWLQNDLAQWEFVWFIVLFILFIVTILSFYYRPPLWITTRKTKSP